MNGFLAWLKEMLSEDNGAASSMRTCFVLAVIVSLGICVFIVVKEWHTLTDIPANMKDFLIWLCGTLGIGKVGQKYFEGGGGNPPTPPTGGTAT